MRRAKDAWVATMRQSDAVERRLAASVSVTIPAPEMAPRGYDYVYAWGSGIDGTAAGDT